MKDKEFLQWMLDRLAQVHDENRDIDYMLRLKCIIESYDKDKITHNLSNPSTLYT